MLEHIIAFLKVPKNNISSNFKEKIGSYEKQIINLMNANKPKKGVSSLPPGQLPPSHMHSTSQPQPQVSQAQSHESQINPQLQPANFQGSVATMQQNMMNLMQPGINLDSGQGNPMNSLQQGPMSSLQQIPISTPQQTNINSLSSQGGVHGIQPNLSILRSGSSMLQHQQQKHQQEQHMMQNPQFKQHHQRQLLQRQQMLQQQQLHQPGKQQLSAQLQTHQMPQLPQISDIKARHGVGAKPGVFQQHLTSGQHSAYPYQQLKLGGSYTVSSPQLLQAASSQILQHSSPQVDQQNHLSSLTKVATPLQSSNSPFVGPTPSPPSAPSTEG